MTATVLHITYIRYRRSGNLLPILLLCCILITHTHWFGKSGLHPLSADRNPSPRGLVNETFFFQILSTFAQESYSSSTSARNKLLDVKYCDANSRKYSVISLELICSLTRSRNLLSQLFLTLYFLFKPGKKWRCWEKNRRANYEDSPSAKSHIYPVRTARKKKT